MAANGPSGLPYHLPNITPANPIPNPGPNPVIPQDLAQAPTGRPAWIAPVPINAAIDGRLNALKSTLENRSENEHRFKQEAYRLILNILYDAKARGNNTITLTPAQSTYLDQVLTQLSVIAGDTSQIDRASLNAILNGLVSQRPTLRLGGWTPKPKRKPTKRILKKRKTIKSHA